MRFSKNKKVLPKHQNIGMDYFAYCSRYKYLGHLITYNLNDNLDVEKRVKDFYSKFFSVKRNFSNLSEGILLYLFKSFCTPDYGLNLWRVDKIDGSREFRAFKVAYSNAVKSLYGLSKYSSTHFIFNASNILILHHLVNYTQCRFFKKLVNEPKGFLYILPTIRHGIIVDSLCRKMKQLYKVTVFDNDLDALKARILYVQRTEERT